MFDHVGFAYNSGETVLRDVSFTAKQGEVTALVGPSGGGKTTVSRLAVRFWDYQKGRITVGGMDVSQIDPEKLMNLYSIVFQDVTLFDNTILENIRLGRKGATDEEVLAAAKLANCEEFAEKLPDKWNTNIGENGCALSGGERQRISIARAFLKDAPIILLDEATASLDVENETAIQEALSRLIKHKTVLIIAHRMRTVAGADQVVVAVGRHRGPSRAARQSCARKDCMPTWWICSRQARTGHLRRGRLFISVAAAKQKKTCDKKSVRKQWPEDPVVSETMRLVKDDAAMESIIAKVMEL